jgi:tRNA A37 threonylcarbamoyladenosine dehydratase
MKERILKINQHCNVNLVEDFISPDNISSIMQNQKFDYIIDATDDIKAKTCILLYGLKNKIPFVICGSAGGKKDASLIKWDKLSNVQHDPLLAKLRYILRKQHGFKEKININCLYSSEPKQNKKSTIQNLNNTDNNSIQTNSCGGLSCDGYGSLVGITATMGFMLGQYVLNKICVE